MYEIQCPQCKGRGIAKLPDHLMATLFLIRQGSHYAHEVSSKHETTNAACNRLKALFNLGFLTRTREGKFWRYEIAKRKNGK